MRRYRYVADRECYNSFIIKFYENDLCNQYCPLECDSFSYDISVISSSLSQNGDNSMYEIYVYYDDLKLISQHAEFDLFDLISNIGGSLSLFLSISFISFLDFFEAICEFFFICLKL